MQHNRGQRPHRGSRGTDHPGTRPLRMPQPQPLQYYVLVEGKADKRTLQPELLEETERLAQEIAEVPASQLRRFYGDVVAFARRLDLDRTISNEAIRTQLALLKARAAYAYKRVEGHQQAQFPEPLLRFFVDHAAAVQDRADYAAFRRIFETLIAFHKFHEKNGRG